MDAFIEPPARIPLFIRVALWVARRRTHEELEPPQLLAWYPKAALGSGVVEVLIAHHDGAVTERMLKMVRMAVSFTASCSFCVGLNSAGWERHMSAAEREAVQGLTALEVVTTLSPRERLAIEYARLLSQTPLAIPRTFGERLTGLFTEREIVVLATTGAQVNYWARLVQALGFPPAG